MVDKEFTQICKEILELDTQIRSLSSQVSADKSEVSEKTAQTLNAKEVVEGFNQAISLIKSDMDGKKEDFDTKYSQITSLLSQLNELKGQIESVLQSTPITDQSVSDKTAYSSQKVEEIKRLLTDSIQELGQTLTNAYTQALSESGSRTTENFEWVKQQVSIRYTKEQADNRFLKKEAKASDSAKLNGLDSSAFSRSNHNHDTAYLSITAKASDSAKLNGLDASQYALASKLFGVSQSIRDVWNDREFGVFYHNNTSRPKCIYMCFEAKVNNSLQVFINGTVVHNCVLDPNITATFSLVVPPDASYKVVCGSLTKQQVVLENKTYSSWVEMG